LTTAAVTPHAGSAVTTFVVASSCPRCGAPLDFGEGSNAVRCRHCASLLLVTGRRRVLRWVIRPRTTALEARKLASFARGAGGVSRGAPRLVFVPYYRLTADELFWRRERVRRVDRACDPQASLDESTRLLRSLGGGAPILDGEYEIDLASRTIERSFLACDDLAALASWSLGVRTGVLRLELFEREALEGDGVVVEPTLAPEAALARALQTQHGGDTIARDVLRVVLSLIWFPLWVVPNEPGKIAVVDGVTGSLIARDVDGAALDALIARRDAARGSEHVVGFRPLCCPNCGWDLPLRAIDVVFHCTSCERSWELRGDELDLIPSDVVAPLAADASATLPLLPVWEVRGAAHGAASQAVRAAAASPSSSAPRVVLPERLFAPAFPWRRVDHLCDLGARLARGAPAHPEIEPVKNMALAGCTLDREDALVLARMVALALLLDDGNVRFAAARGGALPEVAVDGATTRLVWLPFAGDAYSVRDPFTGYALPRRAVEDLLR
jgi:DNA-directed RNA polymerase subunit RPC12/RpoP